MPATRRIDHRFHRSSLAIRTFSAVIAAALLVQPGMNPAVAAVAVAEQVNIRTGASVTVSGRGFGHGIGLSQYGARARAAGGIAYREILDFYYPGTGQATQANTPIRVRLLADTDDELRVVAVSGMTMTDGNGATRTLGFADATATQWRVLRNANNTGMVVFGLVSGQWRLWSTSALPAPLTLTTPTGLVRVVMPDGTQREYRGTARAINDGSAPNIATVNVVPMESYLRSVVPSEVPASWPTEALRSQAVAARTYASFERRAHTSTRAWDTCDTTQCQVYLGYRTRSSSGAIVTTNEHPSTDAAISATANQIRTWNGAPALTQFSASNGGWTAPGSQPYLVAKRDTWDGIGNPVHSWTVSLSSSQIRAAYPGVGEPRGLTVTSRSGPGEWGGRVESVTIRGTLGSATVTGAAFRTAFGLRSAWWKVTGSRKEPDFTAEGRPDLLARQPSGNLNVYEGTGAGGFATGLRQVGSGWQVMTHVSKASDLNGDGNADVLAIDGSGNLWLYPANRSGGFAARSHVGTGWHVMRAVLAPGDITGDGRADVLAVDGAGALWLYPGTGSGAVSARRAIGSGWDVMTAVLGAGDMNADGAADVVARHRDGRLLLYRGRADGSVAAGVGIGTGWQVMRLLTVSGDWTGDGRPDILASSADGTLYLYPWSGSAFEPRQVIGTGWQVYDLLP